MSNESETWMQIMCKAACPHHHELQPNWLFDQNRVRNRYSSILQLHNGSADMIAKTSLCAKTVSLFAKQTTRLSMCNTCCGDRKGFIRRILSEVFSKHICLGEIGTWNIVSYCIKYCFKIVKIKNSNKNAISYSLGWYHDHHHHHGLCYCIDTQYLEKAPDYN